jgi:hypothetical protein
MKDTVETYRMALRFRLHDSGRLSAVNLGGSDIVDGGERR